MGMVNNRGRQSKNGNRKVTERYGHGRKFIEQQFELNIFLRNLKRLKQLFMYVRLGEHEGRATASRIFSLKGFFDF